MPRKRQINAEPGRDLRSTIDAATEPVRSAAWVVEERLLWRAADRARPAIEAARWPLERLYWFLRQHLVWPLQDRIAGYERAVASGAAAVAAVGALATAAVLLPGAGEEPQRLVSSGGAALPAKSSAPEPADRDRPPEPVLQGAPPALAVSGGAASGEAGGDAAALGSSSALTGAEGGASASASKRAVSAGPAAMRVARRFSAAFVRYEVGQRDPRTEAVFAETTTPRLAKALAQRPPRQPSTVEVPRARILNLVPGPRRGKTYTVSASLLRLGLTSELRLEMRKKNGNWLITDVRG